MMNKPRMPWEVTEPTPKTRFWQTLTAILYIVSGIVSFFASLAVLPIFGLSGLALYGIAVLVCAIVMAIIWLFSHIADLFGSF